MHFSGNPLRGLYRAEPGDNRGRRIYLPARGTGALPTHGLEGAADPAPFATWLCAPGGGSNTVVGENNNTLKGQGTSGGKGLPRVCAGETL
ncbi:hypothetical protein GCM10011313_07940 [Mycetocola zhadangensis]|nr:hypothetical protein GCM10011313_07940 [Mycetocola zhadangensis]